MPMDEDRPEPYIAAENTYLPAPGHIDERTLCLALAQLTLRYGHANQSKGFSAWYDTEIDLPTEARLNYLVSRSVDGKTVRVTAWISGEGLAKPPVGMPS